MRYAADVVRGCTRLGLNDPALTAAVESLLLDAEAQWSRFQVKGDPQQGQHQHLPAGDPFGVASLDAAHLAALMCDLSSDAAALTGGKPKVRGAVARLLASKRLEPQRDSGGQGSGIPVPVLIQLFSIFASGAEASAASVATSAETHETARPASAVVAGDLTSQLRKEMVVIGKLAGALEPLVSPASIAAVRPEDRAVLASAASRAIAASTATGMTVDGNSQLQELWDALSRAK